MRIEAPPHPPKQGKRAANPQISRTFRGPQPPVNSQKYCRTNGRRTAVQMGGVLLGFPKSQEGTAVQMGGVLPYKLGVYCRTFFETSRGWGFSNSSEN